MLGVVPDSRMSSEGVRSRVIFHNGTFVGCPDAEFVVVQGDRIAALGTESPVSAQMLDDPDRIDLNGQALLPGFIDAHVHIFGSGLTEMGWRIPLEGLSRAETNDALAEAVKARGAGTWVLGTGWDESRWSDATYLSREELDRFSPTSPVGVVRMDGHLLVLNSKGLQAMSEILSADAFDGLVDTETGEVREEAAWKVTGTLEPDESTLSDALRAAACLCHRQGITTVHTMAPQSRVPMLLAAKGRDRLRVTVFQKAVTADEVLKVRETDDFDGTWVSFGGIKVFADGSLGAGNAALGEAYVDGGTGQLNHSDESLQGILRASEEQGWRTAIHAIGDRAIAQVLEAHVAVDSSPELRHRIEHFELPAEEQIEHVADLGLYLSMQPNFIGNWSGPESMYERKLGRVRDEVSNPLRRILDEGVALAFGSDGMPISPLYGLHWAVNGSYPSQRLTAEEAISAYTEGGALFGFEEGAKGVLEAGALADLVILDRDPTADPGQIAERRVVATYVGGECVYRAKEA